MVTNSSLLPKLVVAVASDDPSLKVPFQEDPETRASWPGPKIATCEACRALHSAGEPCPACAADEVK